jgi:hypothetical protein
MLGAPFGRTTRSLADKFLSALFAAEFSEIQPNPGK